MRNFDYSFLKSASIPAAMLGKAVSIGSLKERMFALRESRKNDFLELERNAKFLSVKGSNAIEGIFTSDQRLTSLMDRSVEPVGHDEQEIAGYRDALTLIHEHHGDMGFDETTILDLHRILLSHTDRKGGSYKTSDNIIMEIDGSGNRRIHFKPLPARDTPHAMEQMVLAYIDAEQEGIEPLLLIPCFILDFLSVHPFDDGNGRMSRLLTLLLLYRHGYDVGKYISFEERIDLTKDRYYGVLTASSVKCHDGTNDYVPFMSYYMDTLLMCYCGLDRCFATLQGKKATKKNRIEAVVLDSIIPISKAEILSALPDVSRTTVEACLGRMLREGRIEKIGNNKGARYRRKRA